MKQKNESIAPKPPLLDHRNLEPENSLSHVSIHDHSAQEKEHYSIPQTPIASFYRAIIPEQSTVLHIQSGSGDLLASLNPFFGIGIDCSKTAVDAAQKKYPRYQFYQSDKRLCSINHQFDYIIVSHALMQSDDAQEFLISLHYWCHPTTRIIIDHYAAHVAALRALAHRCGIAQSAGYQQLFSKKTMSDLFTLTNFELISSGCHTLIARPIPLIAGFFNRFFIALPLINRLAIYRYAVIRPQPHTKNSSNASVSIIIPCRNEAGNIESAVKRCPAMGSSTEIIFVEGNSSDETNSEIERVAHEYPDKKIRFFTQSGKGKADAVRKGFAHAAGDIVMILDGDLTMPPEELPKFFNLLVSGRAECVNGSRLIYPMEKEAMTFLAFLANHGFALLLSWVMNQKISDSLCGTKVLWKTDYERIAKARSVSGIQDPFGDFDLLLGAAQLHLKIVDIPIHYKKRVYGQSNISRFYDVWFLLWIVVKSAYQLRIR